MQRKNITHLQPNLTTWLTEKLIATDPQAAAHALQSLATHEAILLLKSLKAEQIITCLNEMDAVKAAAILRRLPSRQAAHVLSRLNVPLAAHIYTAFSVPQKEKMKSLFSAHLLQIFEQATAWPSGSAGAVMKRDFVSFKTEVTLADILDKLKNLPRKKIPNLCFVIGKEGELKGAISTAELVFCDSHSVAGSVMHSVQSLTADQSATKAIEILQTGQMLVPVLDNKQVLLGVLSWIDLWKLHPPKTSFLKGFFKNK